LAETVLIQHLAGGGRRQEGDEILGQLFVGAVRGGGDGVGYRRVAGRGQHDLDLVACRRGIRAIHEAGFDFAPAHVVENLADAVGLHELRRQGRPQSSGFERLLGVAASGHRGGLADGDLLDRLAGQVLQGLELQAFLCGLDQHEGIAGEIDTRGGVEQLLFHAAVQGGLIGAGQHVHGCALADLLQQRARCGEVVADGHAGFAGFELRRQRLEGIGQAGCGRHGELLGRGCACQGQRGDERGSQTGERGQAAGTGQCHGIKLRINGWTENGSTPPGSRWTAPR